MLVFPQLVKMYSRACKFDLFLARTKRHTGNESLQIFLLTLGGALHGKAGLQLFPVNSVDKAVL